MSDTSSFDSLNSDNEFYKCINTLEREVSQKYNMFMEKKYIENMEMEKINSPIDNKLGGGTTDTKIENIESSKIKNNDDELYSKIESLKDVKVGEINHKGQIINVYIDRNKKKYVNYKGKRVYT